MCVSFPAGVPLGALDFVTKCAKGNMKNQVISVILLCGYCKL